MKTAGLRIFHPMERFQVMGFTQVITSLPRLYTDFKKIKKEILEKNPKGVILIDYPDFEYAASKSFAQKGYRGKIIHYVCPSVWAWRKKRISKLTNTLDHLLAIFPFEKSYFAETKLPVTFVGHPLVAAIGHNSEKAAIKSQLIAIFPGSRRHEIEHNLPLQLAAAKKMGPDYSVAVSVARPELLELIQKYTDPAITLVLSDKRYELMRTASCALATSGTIVLELGLHATPTIVTYQLTRLNYLLGRYLFRIRLPFYTLVNIICGKEVYPEFIHKKLSSETIFHAVQSMLKNAETCRQECARLRHLLTEQDASAHAAESFKRLSFKCPCHSGKLYIECCAPYHQGENPPTPLALMRSRYSAYALSEINYIIATTHPDNPDSTLPISQRKQKIKNFCKNTQFKGLEILSAEGFTVTFRAILMQGGRDSSFTEKSEFAQINGRWFYLKAS